MLKILEQHRCHRRQMLTIGGTALAGLAIPSLLRSAETVTNQQNSAIASPLGAMGPELKRYLSGKSVIFLFQQGGPSQLETFDPKADAPSGVRTLTGTCSTSLPGVEFGETLPQLATLADRLCVVRSFQTNNAGHNIQPLVGKESLETNIGAHYARVAGATHPANGLPTTAVLYPSSVSTDVPGPEARGNLLATGTYASSFAPFVPGGSGQLQKDMELNLPASRFFDDRRSLLQGLDRLQQDLEVRGEFGALNDLQQQSYELLRSGGVSKALDLSLEDPSILAQYDTAKYVNKKLAGKVNRGSRGYYQAQQQSIGKLLLMARRLCEVGAGFVTIHAGYAGIWDMHGDGNNLNIVDGMEAVGRPFDHAVAAFIRDVEARGLSDRILLVTCGEMGRTPRINGKGGRDHWAKLSPLMLTGGGLPQGAVIGQSTRDGGEPLSDPLTPQHLISTILQTLIDPAHLRLDPTMPPQINQLMQHPTLTPPA
ncbi:MAG: DUF1501 domain-containing protein [Planctomycetaceae bacterium]